MPRYSLTCVENPVKGDSGSMSVALWKENGAVKMSDNGARPEVGKVIRVGSPFARTMSTQDWWQTSLIQSIEVDKPTYVKFRTMNSTYEWKCDG